MSKKQEVLNDLRECIAALEDIETEFPEIEKIPSILDNLRTMGTEIDENLN